MKSKQSMLPALLVGVLSNALLNERCAYWTQAGTLTSLAAAALLAGLSCGFARLWQGGRCPITQLLFATILAVGTVPELLRLATLYRMAYPGITTLAGVCLAVLTPVIYLRRKAALVQTANIVLALAVMGWLFLVVTASGRLAIENLNTNALQPSALFDAWKSQITLYPEYFLVALWPREDTKNLWSAKISLWAVYGGLAGNLVVELLFGAGLLQTEQPLHTAARFGAISVFTRLEWIQMILWTMAVIVKIALYSYVAVQLTAQVFLPTARAEYVLPWQGFLAAAAAMSVVAALLKPWPIARLFAAQNLVLWLLPVCMLIERGMQCLIKLKKGC